jgi:hypothetical protein
VLCFLDAPFAREPFFAVLFFAVLFFAVLFLEDVLFDVLFNGALFVLCLALSVARVGILPSFNFRCKYPVELRMPYNPSGSPNAIVRATSAHVQPS